MSYFCNNCQKFKFAPISTSTCKIWWRLGNPRLSHCVFLIFKMAAVQNLGFSSFSNIFQKIEFAPISTSTWKIWWRSDDPRPSYCVFSILKKWRLSASLDFHIFAIFLKNWNLRQFLPRVAKFGEDLTIYGRFIACFRFAKWRPPAILDFVWRHSGQSMTCVWWFLECPKIVRWSYLYFARYRDFHIRPVWVEITYSRPFGGFLGDITAKWIPILSQPPKGRFLDENTSYEP